MGQYNPNSSGSIAKALLSLGIMSGLVVVGVVVGSGSSDSPPTLAEADSESIIGSSLSLFSGGPYTNLGTGETYASIAAEDYIQPLVRGSQSSLGDLKTDLWTSDEFALMAAEAYGERFIGSSLTHSSVPLRTIVGTWEGYRLVDEVYEERLAR